MKVGDRIREERQKLGWSQQKLGATAGGRGVTQINAYECGRSNPSPPVLAEIAAALNVTVSELSGLVVSNSTIPLTIESLLEELKERLSKLLNFDENRIVIQITIS